MVKLTAVASFSTEIVHNVSVKSIGRYPAMVKFTAVASFSTEIGHNISVACFSTEIVHDVSGQLQH
jgi:hypothetical protein